MAIIPKFTRTQHNVTPNWGWPTEFDSFFTNALQDFPTFSKEMNGFAKNWNPTMDISETDDEFKVKLEMPGMTEKDVDVTFQDNTLYIKGEKKIEKEDEKENYHRMESSYGQFLRTVPFGVKIDEDKVKAKFENGVLKIKLGKSNETMEKTRKIKINS